ncbi:MAG: glycosyltransferase family 4 protein [Burkholderiales bacterium]|nr:glycosyltransferase family 4 protein [Burkholderiales bacterium]
MHDKPMMRVLLLQDRLTGNNWGGVQTMTHTLELALQEQGFAVTALAWQETKFGELLHAARQSDVLVASHNFGPTYCGVALKTLTRKPLVSWVHGPLLDVLRMSKATWWKRRWLKHVYGYVDRFVCVSQTTEGSLLGFLSGIRTVVIPNGLAPLIDNAESFVSDVRTISSINLSIGYIGRLSEEKRPHLLLETLRALPDDAHLSVVGGGVLRPELEDAGKDLMANDRLKFLGCQVSNRNLYTPYQVTLLTSLYEGCPMTALESLACGVPCVALPIPAVRELFAQDAPYLLAHDETPQALAIAVLNLVRMPQEQVRQDMARIVSNHSLILFANSWQTVINGVIK